MKTWFLTQDSARIDPIALQIKGFSFRELEEYCWHSIIDFSLFSQQNLTFEHSMDAKIDLEVIGTRDSRILVSRQFDYSKNPRII